MCATLPHRNWILNGEMYTNMSKLNGWKRLLLVLTILYMLAVLCIGLWFYSDSTQEGHRGSLGKQVFTVFTPVTDLDIQLRRKSVIDRCVKEGFWFKDLSGESRRLGKESCQDFGDLSLKINSRKYEVKPNIAGFIITVLIVPIIVWFLFYCVLVVGKGFSRKRKQKMLSRTESKVKLN